MLSAQSRAFTAATLLAAVSVVSSCGGDSPTGPGPGVTQPGTFQRTMGTGASERGDAVRQTPDGGYLILGATWTDILVTKTDASGTPVVERPLRGESHWYIRDATPTRDGGFVAVGRTQSVAVLKFNSDAHLEWQQPIDGLNQSSGLTITQTPDDGYAIVGGTATGIVQVQPLRLIKTDASGVVVWDAVRDESSLQIWALETTPVGDFVMAGTKQNPEGSGNYDVYLCQTNPDGGIRWEKLYGAAASDHAYCATLLEQGIGLGGQWGDGAFVMMTNPDGGQLWREAFADWSVQAMVPDRGGLVVTGMKWATHGTALLARLDTEGRTTWTRQFGRGAGDSGSAVALADDGFIVTGQSRDPEFDDTDILLVRTRSDGRAPAMQGKPPCPDVGTPPPAPAPPTPIERDWSLARGPANQGSVHGFTQRGNGDVLGVYARHIFRFSGGRWHSFDVQAPDLLYDIAAVEEDYLIATGFNHTLFHFDGSTWKSYTSPVPHYSYSVLGDVWGTSRYDAFAVGSDGAIIHFDGASWTAMSSGITDNILAVWGSASNDVWAASQHGTILHYDGDEWTPSHVHGGELRGIWGSAAGDVYAVGFAGALLHFNGFEWSTETVADVNLLDIDGRGAADIYIVGGTLESAGLLLHHNGTSWSDVSTDITGEIPPRLSDVFADASGRVFVTRDDLDLRSYWFDGLAWHETESERPTLNGVWAHSSDYAIAVGHEGEILKWDGQSWEPMASGTTVELQAVFGFAPDDIFVGGRDGSIRHFDGVSWEPAFSPASYVHSIWGRAPDDVLAGGAQLIHYDGDAWTDITPKGGGIMLGVHGFGDVDAYGATHGGVWHFDGCKWTRVWETTESLLSVWSQPGPLVVAVGEHGTVARLQGTSWQSLDTGTNEYFTDVWGRGANDVFVVGNAVFAGYYVMLHFDGVSWTTLPRVASFALNDVHGTADGTVFAVGNGGVIVHGIPRSSVSAR